MLTVVALPVTTSDCDDAFEPTASDVAVKFDEALIVVVMIPVSVEEIAPTVLAAPVDVIDNDVNAVALVACVIAIAPADVPLEIAKLAAVAPEPAYVAVSVPAPVPLIPTVVPAATLLNVTFCEDLSEVTEVSPVSVEKS
jgi:hypothetical protein